MKRLDRLQLTDRIRRIRDTLTQDLVERDVAVRLALLAALAGEHLLLVGPPGTAKSLVARRLHRAFKDAVYFERLLTRFSVPEELFGPLSIKGLEEDRYERLTDSYLPTASIAFLDEIFKANSAILNALLTLLNEREFDNGTRRVRTPLVAVVGASNELPEDEELDALFDRFLLRLHVGPVSREAFPSLLGLGNDVEPEIGKDLQLTMDDIREVRDIADKLVAVPDDVTDLLCDLREECQAKDIMVSDRRWGKIVKLLKTSAWTNEREDVSIWDCWLLQHCLWSKTEDREKIHEWYAARVGAVAEKPSRLLSMVGAFEEQFRKDKEERSQKRNEGGELLYSGKDGKETPDKQGQEYRNGEKLYILLQGLFSNSFYHYQHLHPDETNEGKGYTRKEIERLEPRLRRGGYPITQDIDQFCEFLRDKKNWFMVALQPSMEPKKHEPDYIRGRLREMEELLTKVNVQRDGVEKRIETLENDIHSHLWVMDSFAKPASQGFEEARTEVVQLIKRLEKVIRGYNELPQKEGEPSFVVGEGS